MDQSTTQQELAGALSVGVPFGRADHDSTGECLKDSERALDNSGFAAEVSALSHRFAVLGVNPGDTVAVMLPNSIAIVTAMFAAWTRGAALTPINPALTDGEAQYQLTDSRARVLISAISGKTLAESVGIEWLDVDEFGSLAPMAAGTVVGQLHDVAANADRDALVIYTSGTTGKPKGCVLSHANIDAMVDSLIRHFEFTPSDRSLVVLPLFHCNGLLISVLSVLTAGGSVVVAPRFDATRFWDDVEEHRPTFFSAVPTMYAMLDERTNRDVDTSSLRFVVCGGAPMPKESIPRFEQRFRVPVVEAYGLSECSVVATCNPVHGIRKAGTVGRALPGQQVRITADNGGWAPQGERGEVVISGPNVMRGYLGKPEATARTVRDGWLHTGDVGYLDEDGYLVLVDRLKDMIIRGGENIYPKEIESVLYEHPAVLEAAVVGRADAIYGEVPVGYLALRDGFEVDEEELRAHCLSRLAKYKTPREFVFLESLPKNSVGKLSKQMLPSSK